MKIAIIGLTVGGKRLAQIIASFYEDSFVDTRDLPVFEKLSTLWQENYDAIICIMATGIVVRGLGRLCYDKMRDPCVLVLDEKGQFVISLLSGHLGGGNQLARELAEHIGGQAVITTASDVTGHTSLDLWAQKNQLEVDNSQKITAKSAQLVNKGSLTLFTECEVESLPEDFIRQASPQTADIIISDSDFSETPALILRPRALCVGLGCNRGTASEDFQDAITELFRDNDLNLQSIAGFASIDLKNDEEGLLEYVELLNRPIQFYTKEQLNSVDNFSSSDVVFAATGAKGVAEPAAVLAAETSIGSGKLIIRKKKWKDVTAAVAIRRIRIVA